ncbi:MULTISPECIES: hypothetical protein [unclassified Variovorax]|jgi:hypothetical protein|uniref:hypothetical protein n=1 Tax=unclassified Variovorax TaxID=663243 RepID=UPI000F7EE54A|nr:MULTISPECIES: hypothetical protein [unclassified Variovorax]RSZ35115.1 hypothetical protein EJO70_24910 [Variovorax sp. 553]RSZ35867.1 hypothetical protein EJO71_25580 [Variovorax sp. 679]
MSKPSRTAAQLQQMLIERIEAIPDLRGLLTDVHRGGVVGTGGDGEGGPTWTVPILTDRSAHRRDIARIIRTLQGQFDLED